MTEQNEHVGLGVADIENVITTIDYACEQGAFKGWQSIQNVLVLRSRLSKFVEYAKATLNEEAQKAANQTTEEAVTDNQGE